MAVIGLQSVPCKLGHRTYNHWTWRPGAAAPFYKRAWQASSRALAARQGPVQPPCCVAPARTSRSQSVASDQAQERVEEGQALQRAAQCSFLPLEPIQELWLRCVCLCHSWLAVFAARFQPFRPLHSAAQIQGPMQAAAVGATGVLQGMDSITGVHANTVPSDSLDFSDYDEWLGVSFGIDSTALVADAVEADPEQQRDLLSEQLTQSIAAAQPHQRWQQRSEVTAPQELAQAAASVVCPDRRFSALMRTLEQVQQAPVHHYENMCNALRVSMRAPLLSCPICRSMPLHAGSMAWNNLPQHPCMTPFPGLLCAQACEQDHPMPASRPPPAAAHDFVSAPSQSLKSDLPFPGCSFGRKRRGLPPFWPLPHCSSLRLMCCGSGCTAEPPSQRRKKC